MRNKLLLTHLEVEDRYKELDQEKISPFFYKISNSKQCLYFVGPHHAFDPEDPQIEVIRNYWNEFLKETEKKKCVVLVEGGKRPVKDDDTEEHLIKSNGEPSFVAYLAYQEDIDYYSPEPDEKEEIEEMVKAFNKADIMYYYIARVALQWNKLNPKPDFAVYINGFLKEYQEITGWKDFDFSVDNFIREHNKRYKHKFKETDEKCFYHDSNPFTSEFSRMSGDIRDNHILNEILKLWKEGKNIFIVFGSGHAIKLERALKEILN
jgi:hypothetical protein